MIVGPPNRTVGAMNLRRALHAGPPVVGGTRLEIPVMSLLSLAMSTCLWLASVDRAGSDAKRSFQSKQDVRQIGLREFVETYLKRGRVGALFLMAGQDLVEFHTTQPAPAAAAWFERALEYFRGRPTDAALTHEGPIRFSLRDPAYLDHLVTAYCARHNRPSVYNVPSSRRTNAQTWRRRCLGGSVVAAAAFWSVTFAQPREVRQSMPSTKSPPDATANGPEKLMKFGQVQSNSDIPEVSFADVAGLEQAKLEIKEFVDFLKSPEKFRNLGAKVPKGALLVGPPGTGKTLLAKAVAGEAKVPFFSTSGSDFIEMFVGVGSSRIRDLFAKARQAGPSIVFIDEIDTIGRNRSGANSMGNGGTDERESTLNALLVELDGFNSSSNIVTLAGTNRGDVLDPALTRPGRFDRRIELSKPSINERLAIFEIHLQPIRLAPGMSRKALGQRLAALTPGFSGAEIRNVCNEAAIIAARRDADSVALSDFETAVERLIGGLKHTGDVLNLKLKSYVAIHEAGHAICGWFLPEADPILKLSIVPRANGALGYTQMLPDDVLLSTKEALEDKIAVLLGGRAAEQLYCPTMTTGASDDLERASRLCRAYVCTFGFDEKIGLRNLDMAGPLGSDVRNDIEERVSRLLKQQWERCLALLSSKKAEIENLSQLLLCKEVISFRDLETVLGKMDKKMSTTTREFVEALPSTSS